MSSDAASAARGRRVEACSLRYATDAGRTATPQVNGGRLVETLKMAPLLKISDLRTSFFTSDGEVRAVKRVTFDIANGQTVGLVGKSGCGKSVTALSILQLLPKGTGRIVGGELAFSRDKILRRFAMRTCAAFAAMKSP